jgi:hypothetical protein
MDREYPEVIEETEDEHYGGPSTEPPTEPSSEPSSPLPQSSAASPDVSSLEVRLWAEKMRAKNAREDETEE